MPPPCMHGFQPGQCASCRSADRPATVADGSKVNGSADDVEERQGWEIFYVPALTGWQVRAPESQALPDSYRSLFLARKAVDRMAGGQQPARPAKRGK